TREDSAAEKLDRLERFLQLYPSLLPEATPLLADLLSVPLHERYPPPDLTPQRQKQKTLEILQALLLEMAVQQPVLLVVEDLHWVDASTLELLRLLVYTRPLAKVF